MRTYVFLTNFREFAKKCSNEYIYVFPLANLDFRDYVRSGRWVGEVSQDNVCAHVKIGGNRRTGAAGNVNW